MRDGRRGGDDLHRHVSEEEAVSRPIHATSAISSSDADSFGWPSQRPPGYCRRAMNGEHRTRCHAQDTLGDAAHDQVVPASSSVRAAHGQIHSVLRRVFENLVCRIAPGGGQDDLFCPKVRGPGHLLELLARFGFYTPDEVDELGARRITGPRLVKRCGRDVQEVQRCVESRGESGSLSVRPRPSIR